ncbi:Gfo/Idh/MocA family protein [Halovivax limisalsi]|uniref:Gfo/Idh/MocA family protein n=1 Tax=Halovivax limisalsi TaxID=1453760 RepID=UPI001FFDBDD3|nr:Gfo/Idh/MocA family oxidoreductase [Halovivax limisalsi]
MALGTAVIGTGIVSRNNHLPALDRNPRTELVAVCDLEYERAREAATAYGCRAYADADDLFETERLDWVHVATPVQTHADLASRAIEAGVPVLVQKPATETALELEQLRSTAADAGVPISVVHNWLYYPVIRDVRRRVATGEIGDVRAVEVTAAGEGSPDETYRGAWVLDLPGGDLEEGLPHPLYLAIGLGGAPRTPEGIDARTRTFGEYDGGDGAEAPGVGAGGGDGTETEAEGERSGVAYDGVTIQYVTERDVLCSITVLSGSARDNGVRIYGTDASLHVDVPTMTVDVHDAAAGPYHFQNERIRRHLEKFRFAIEGAGNEAVRYAKSRIEDDLDVHLETSPDGHYYLINEAAKALERGEQPPVPLSQSAWTLELMERVRAAVGREVAGGRVESR